jgi:hypothetical protein
VGHTFAKVLPLALGAAISPVILLLQVATLASPRYPVRRALIVLSSTALVVAGVMVLIATTDHQAATPPKSDAAVGGWIKVVLAILLLAVAIRTALAPAPDEPPAAAEESQASVHALRYFLLGVGAMVTNLTTIVLLIPATHDAATADLPADDRLLVMVVIALITLFPAYGPLLVLAALGRRGPVALAAFGAWLRVHRRTVTVVVSLGFAAYLGISGYVALT